MAPREEVKPDPADAGVPKEELDAVDEADYESFPASDPPSWWGGHG